MKAAVYACGEEYDLQGAHLYEPEIKFLGKKIRKERATKLLDVCCGTGIVTIPLASALQMVTGLDRSEPMLSQARRKAVGIQNINFVRDDATNFDLSTS